MKLSAKKIKDFSNVEIFPNNALKTIDMGKKLYLIVDPKLLNHEVFTSKTYLDLITEYEKQGWKYHSIVSGKLYFYKKKSYIKRFLNWIK